MGRTAKFLSLPGRDRRLLIDAVLTLARTAIGLRAIGFDAVRRRAMTMSRRGRPWCGPPPRRTVAPPPPERLAWAVRAAGGAIPGGSNCLVRALATQVLLTRYGYPSALKIGVHKSADGRLAAHAWLESAGAVIIGDFELDSYTTLRPSLSVEPGA